MNLHNKRHKEHFDNPTSIYLSSLRRYPLISRGIEAQYSILMRYAQLEMLDRAFRDISTFSIFDNLNKRISEGSVSYRDIVRIDGTPSEINKKQTEFVEQLTSVIASQKKLIYLKKQLLKRQCSIKFITSVGEHEDNYVSLCRSIPFNNNWVRDILSTYKRSLIDTQDVDGLEAISTLEDQYNAARSKLVEASVRLVITIAKRYVKDSMELADLIQEGNRGLITAAENFDYRKGYKFSTYAIWWIRQAITRSLNERSRMIRIPTSLIQVMNSIDHFINDFHNKHRNFPSVDEVATGLKIPKEKVLKAYAGSISMVYLDMEAAFDSETLIGDLVEDTSVEDPLGRLSMEDLREKINLLLSTLRVKDKEALLMRYGMDDGRVQTLSEIAGKLDRTSEWVRQTCLKSLKQLRNHRVKELLSPWIEDGEIPEFDDNE